MSYASIKQTHVYLLFKESRSGNEVRQEQFGSVNGSGSSSGIVTVAMKMVLVMVIAVAMVVGVIVTIQQW